ncbi:MAG: Ig-like domain-containing protein [bacterium]
MRKLKVYFLLFLFLAISVPYCRALPDLTVSNILFSEDYPDSGEVFTASATIHNSGTGYSERIFAKNIEEAQPELRQFSLHYGFWVAQAFQYAEDVNLTGISLHIRDSAEYVYDDSLTVTIETNLSTNVPSGLLVVEKASTTVNSSGGWWYWNDFIFPELVPLSANTTYWIVAHNYAVDYSTYGYSVIQTTCNYYTDGIEVYSYDQGSTWAEWTDRDLLFKAYRSTTTIVKFYDSDPDSGGYLIGTDEISPVPSSGDVIASISTSTSYGYHNIYAHVNRDNYIVEQSTTNNKAYETIAVDFPRVISAETIDDNLNGCIDAYHIVFNEAIDDSTLIQTSTCGFVVAGYTGLRVLTTLATHFDVVNDTDIYLCFTESGIPDTGLLPQITYSSTTGKLTDFDGNPLLDIDERDITETDGTSPAIYPLLSFPQNGALGIAIDASIQIIFAEEMNVYTTTGAIKVEAIVNKDGETITPPQTISWSFLSSFDETTHRHKFIFQPVSPLKNNHTYQVTVDTTATDTNGHNLAGFEFSFTTISNCNESNTFVSGDGEMRITLNAGTLKEDFSVKISTSPLKHSAKKTNIIEANSKLDNDDDPFSFILEPAVVEIEAFDANGNPITDTFEIPATITLPYEDNNPDDGIVDGTTPPLREETLKVYWLDESHSLWVKLSGSKVDTGSNRVSADTFHFSIFGLHGEGTADLSDAYAYPVPFIPSRGDTDITFTNISPLCTIKIYTLNGELVSTIEHTSGATSYSWDVTNDGGDRLGSGIYLYLIKDAKNKKKGKLIIIR